MSTHWTSSGIRYFLFFHTVSPSHIYICEGHSDIRVTVRTDLCCTGISIDICTSKFRYWTRIRTGKKWMNTELRLFSLRQTWKKDTKKKTPQLSRLTKARTMSLKPKRIPGWKQPRGVCFWWAEHVKARRGFSTACKQPRGGAEVCFSLWWLEL